MILGLVFPRMDDEVATGRAAGDRSKAPAIARAAAILRLLGRSDAALGLQPIARELGLVPSTCLYVLRALVAEELVSFDSDTKRYALEAGVLTLARDWLRRDRFADLAQPALDRIGRRFEATVLGVQIVGLDHIIVVAAAEEAGGSVRLSAGVGSRFPALISATGRCIAAFGGYRESDIEARFARLRWDDAPTWDMWREQVQATHAQGYAVDDGHYIAGVTVVAAPVWKAVGRPSHALVALGLGGALRRSGTGELGKALVVAARGLTGQLGGGRS
jgi:DNA-binding IclR family transcriptional regulator